MKLRNKKTGEVVEIKDISMKHNRLFYSLYDGRGNFKYEVTSLAELNEEWEDYEEPKGKALYWMILTLENFIENEPDDKWVDLEDCKQMLEKLKAWQRLKDKGFRFSHFVMYFEDKCGKVNFKWNTDEKPYSEFEKDLLIIFGGEE